MTDDTLLPDSPPSLREVVVTLVVQMIELQALMNDLHSLVAQSRLEGFMPDADGRQAAVQDLAAVSVRLRERSDRTAAELRGLANRMVASDV